MSVPAPASASDVAQLLASADRDGQCVTAVGGGTKTGALNDGFSPSVTFSTKALTEGFAHYAGDLVATLPVGLTLGEANRRLAMSGQWLPLDPPSSDVATIGGIVACNDSGPRRHRYGAPRDVIIGIEVALTDGRVVKAGGRVVKNVAGYDLSRLFCGSHGSLGIITSATFKLAPMERDSCTVVARYDTHARAASVAQTLVHSSVTPSTIEIQGPPWRLLVRFESTAEAATQMAHVARALVATESDLVRGDDERALWEDHQSSVWSTEGILFKLSVLPTNVARLLAAIEPSLAQCDHWRSTGRAGLGVLFVRARGTHAAIAAAVQSYVDATVAIGGHAQLLDGSEMVRQQINTMRRTAPSALMQAVKDRFDPHHILRPVPGGA